METFKKCGVSLSIMESEYIAMVDCVCELVWLEFTKGPIENNHTKHINMKYHLMHTWFYEERINLKYI